MVTLSEAQLAQWLADFLLPFFRVAAIFTTAPVLSQRQVPARFRILLAAGITLLIVPGLPPAPVVDLFSLGAIVMIAQQIVIGLAMGFMLQLALQALVFGGQLMAYSMGLGFANMMDPANGAQVPVVSQYWLILGLLTFVITNGHLLFIETVANSFQLLPVAPDGITRAGFWELVSWGGQLFSAGLLMSLPVVVALKLVNIGMGVITRAAPQLNIFAVGFPITLLMGLLLMWAILPSLMANFNELMMAAMAATADILRLR